MTIRFAAIGITHSHIYGQIDCLARAGASSSPSARAEDDVAGAFAAEASAGQARRGPARDPRGPVDPAWC